MCPCVCVSTVCSQCGDPALSMGVYMEPPRSRCHLISAGALAAQAGGLGDGSKTAAPLRPSLAQAPGGRLGPDHPRPPAPPPPKPGAGKALGSAGTMPSGSAPRAASVLAGTPLPPSFPLPGDPAGGPGSFSAAWPCPLQARGIRKALGKGEGVVSRPEVRAMLLYSLPSGSSKSQRQAPKGTKPPQPLSPAPRPPAAFPQTGRSAVRQSAAWSRPLTPTS